MDAIKQLNVTQGSPPPNLANKSGNGPNNESDLASVITTMLVNVWMAALVFVVFMLVNKRFPWCYQARLARPNFRETRRAPPQLPISSFGWIKMLLKMKHEVIVDTVGLDATMYLRFFDFGFKYFAILALVCGGILLPIHASESPRTSAQFQFNDLTIKNVKASTSKLWAHVLCSYFATLLLFYFIYKEYKQYAKLRHNYYLSNKKTDLRAEQLSVFIQDIPSDLRDSEKLDAFLRELYPDSLANAVVVKDTSEMQKLVHKRESIMEDLERAISAMELSDSSERPQHRPSFYKSKVDSIDNYHSEIKRLNEEVNDLREQEKFNTPSGFATFKTFEAAALARQMPLSIVPFEMTSRVAPEPRDVYWPNLRMSSQERCMRKAVVWSLMLLLSVFYMIPVTILSNFLSLKSIQSWWPGLANVLLASPALKGFIEGILPGLSLIIFMALLPPLLRKLSIMQGIEATSWIETNVFVMYFLFQFVNFFLVSAISKDLFTTIEESGGDLFKLIVTFGNSLPDQSTTFLNYIMLRTFSSMPMKLLRINKLLLGCLKLKYMAKTAREVESATKPGSFNYGTNYPMWVLIFILGLTYAQVAPLILPFTALFFLMGGLVQRYLLTYVFEVQSEGGGELFPRVLHRILVGIIVSHLVLICSLLQQSAFYEVIMILPLILSSALFFDSLSTTFTKMGQCLARKEIIALDKNLATRNSITIDRFTDVQDIRKQGHSAYVPDWEEEPDIDVGEVEDCASKNVPLLRRLSHSGSVIRKLVMDVGERDKVQL